jgi:hypothetical protein
MSKVPKSTPHSDLDGVHQDERPNIETAVKTGGDAGDLDRARKNSAGRPPYSGDSKPK